MGGSHPYPVTVDIISTQQVVAAGLRTILTQTRSLPFAIEFGPIDGEADVVLYDVIMLDHGDGQDLDYLLKQAASTVIAVDRSLKPELGANARDRGVEWVIDLGITGDDLAKVLGEAVAGTLQDSTSADAWTASAWPGQEMGLSAREAEILGWIVLHDSNQEIADRLFLSLNSIKTYIRMAYRKMGVRDRGSAVSWAIAHGFPTT